MLTTNNYQYKDTENHWVWERTLNTILYKEVEQQRNNAGCIAYQLVIKNQEKEMPF